MKKQAICSLFWIVFVRFTILSFFFVNVHHAIFGWLCLVVVLAVLNFNWVRALVSVIHGVCTCPFCRQRRGLANKWAMLRFLSHKRRMLPVVNSKHACRTRFSKRGFALGCHRYILMEDIDLCDHVVINLWFLLRITSQVSDCRFSNRLQIRRLKRSVLNALLAKVQDLLVICCQIMRSRGRGTCELKWRVFRKKLWAWPEVQRRLSLASRSGTNLLRLQVAGICLESACPCLS